MNHGHQVRAWISCKNESSVTLAHSRCHVARFAASKAPPPPPHRDPWFAHRDNYWRRSILFSSFLSIHLSSSETMIIRRWRWKLGKLSAFDEDLHWVYIGKRVDVICCYVWLKVGGEILGRLFGWRIGGGDGGKRRLMTSFSRASGFSGLEQCEKTRDDKGLCGEIYQWVVNEEAYEWFSYFARDYGSFLCSVFVKQFM